MSDFEKDIRFRQAASFGGLHVATRDEYTCFKQLRTALKGEVISWSCSTGFEELGKVVDSTTDPFDSCAKAAELLKGDRKTVVFCGMSAFIEDDPFLQRGLIDLVKRFRKTGKLFILLDRLPSLPPVLSDEIATVVHPLPGREVGEDLIKMVESKTGLTLEPSLAEEAISAVQGLTSSRQADAFSLAIVDVLLQKKEGVSSPCFRLEVLRRYKEQEIGKLDYLKIIEPEKSFSDLLGNDYFKEWFGRRKEAFTEEARAFGVPVPKGVLLVGPPGTGKTRLGEAAAKFLGFPFLAVDIGSLFSSMLGESEANITKLLEIAERMSPCVLLLDEIERLAGNASGEKDGGTSDRVIGKLLTWMSLKQDPIFVVFTSNEASNLPAALVRKGRLDETFFVDFAQASEREAIFKHYLNRGRSEVKRFEELVARTDQWAPAEIEAVVGEARLKAFHDGRRGVTEQDLFEEIEKTVPVSRSMAPQVAKMREWANAYARLTSKGGEKDA